MKLKLLKDVGSVNAGEVCTFPDDVAERLISLKAAYEYTGESKVEKPMSPPPSPAPSKRMSSALIEKTLVEK